MQQVAQPWVILSMTQSSFLVGLDTFIMNAPGWIFTLWGGVIADRFDRKKIVLVCQTMQFICILILLVALLTAQLQIWMILLASFVVGTTDSLSMPAFMAIIPSLVTEDELPRAIALNSTQFNLSRILGPAVAGVVIAAWGATVCYGANLVSFIPFFLSLYWIYPKTPAGQRALQNEAPAPVRFSEFSGLLRDKTFLLPLVTIFTSTLLCSPVMTFAAVIVKDVFHGAASEVGQTMAAFGIGGVLGALVTSVSKTKYFTSLKMANFVSVLLGLTLVLASVTSSLIWIQAALAVTGAGMAIVGTTVNSILQKKAQDHFRGRVISLFQLAMHGGIGLGSLFVGVTSSLLGVQSALLINGIAAVLIQGLILLLR